MVLARLAAPQSAWADLVRGGEVAKHGQPHAVAGTCVGSVCVVFVCVSLCLRFRVCVRLSLRLRLLLLGVCSFRFSAYHASPGHLQVGYALVHVCKHAVATTINSFRSPVWYS